MKLYSTSYEKVLNLLCLVKRKARLFFTKNKEIQIVKINRGTNPAVSSGYEYIYWDIKNFLYVSINGVRCFNDNSVLYFNSGNSELNFTVVGWNQKTNFQLKNENNFKLSTIKATQSPRLNDYPVSTFQELVTKFQSKPKLSISSFNAKSLTKQEISIPKFKLENYVE